MAPRSTSRIKLTPPKGGLFCRSIIAAQPAMDRNSRMRFFGDQDGNEAQDVLYGVSAAIRRYLWIDRERMGVEGVSYGGQLSDWRITQTNEFKAAIPTAGISNLISYNYMPTTTNKIGRASCRERV